MNNKQILRIISLLEQNPNHDSFYIHNRISHGKYSVYMFSARLSSEEEFRAEYESCLTGHNIYSNVKIKELLNIPSQAIHLGIEHINNPDSSGWKNTSGTYGISWTEIYS